LKISVLQHLVVPDLIIEPIKYEHSLVRPTSFQPDPTILVLFFAPWGTPERRRISTSSMSRRRKKELKQSTSTGFLNILHRNHQTAVKII
jgi:hypothetical protein